MNSTRSEWEGETTVSSRKDEAISNTVSFEARAAKPFGEMKVLDFFPLVTRRL